MSSASWARATSSLRSPTRTNSVTSTCALRRCSASHRNVWRTQKNLTDRTRRRRPPRNRRSSDAGARLDTLRARPLHFVLKETPAERHLTTETRESREGRAESSERTDTVAHLRRAPTRRRAAHAVFGELVRRAAPRARRRALPRR